MVDWSELPYDCLEVIMKYHETHWNKKKLIKEFRRLVFDFLPFNGVSLLTTVFYFGEHNIKNCLQDYRDFF
jgi:hypothetical protein